LLPGTLPSSAIVISRKCSRFPSDEHCFDKVVGENVVLIAPASSRRVLCSGNARRFGSFSNKTPMFSGSAMPTEMALRPSSIESALSGPGDLESTALLLDIDGTILDVAVTPGSVVVSDALRSSLKELHAKCGGALALVSGRLIYDIDNLFAPLRLPAIGGHGAEMRVSAEMPTHAQHADAISDALRKLVAAAVADDPRLIVEDKTTSLAVHYRLAPQMEETLKTRIAAIVSRSAVQNLEVMHGKAVIEIKSSHFSKGTAVQEMMKNPPFQGRKPIFIGDDTTDVTVFKILPALGGIGYSVEGFMPGANGIFGSPHEVRSWLASLCEREGNHRQ
jgi:trehalose 6-phosphate phosphatase